MAELIRLERVSAGYGEKPVLCEVSIALSAGELCAILGPNGSGKSTLLRVMAGLLAPSEGSVTIGGDAIGSLDRSEVARRVAIVPQQSFVAFGFTVREVVTMGRAPHQGAWLRLGERDRSAVAAVLAACELEALSERPVATLSGGEQKRVQIARALAQETPLLLLDEATAHLDVRHARAHDRLVRAQVRERDIACAAVLHDLAAAAQHADRVLLMRAGRIVADGAVAEVMRPELLSEVFGADIRALEHEGRRWFLAE